VIAAQLATSSAVLARSKQYSADLVAQERPVIKAKAAAGEGSSSVHAAGKVALVIQIRGVAALDPRSPAQNPGEAELLTLQAR
jgi:hypothetical protein